MRCCLADTIAGRERAVAPGRVADRDRRVADLHGASSCRARAARSSRPSGSTPSSARSVSSSLPSTRAGTVWSSEKVTEMSVAPATTWALVSSRPSLVDHEAGRAGDAAVRALGEVQRGGVGLQRARPHEHHARRVALVDLARRQARGALRPSGWRSRRARTSGPPCASCRRRPRPCRAACRPSRRRRSARRRAWVGTLASPSSSSRRPTREGQVNPREPCVADQRSCSVPAVSSAQAASMSAARISVSPISTASTPTRSSSSSWSREE